MRFSFTNLALYISIFNLIKNPLHWFWTKNFFLFNTLDSLDIVQMNHSKQHKCLISNVEKILYVIKVIYVNKIGILHAFVFVKPMPDKISDICQLKWLETLSKVKPQGTSSHYVFDSVCHGTSKCTTLYKPPAIWNTV